MNKGLIKIGNVLAKNSPTILTGIAVASGLSAVIFAIKDTPKAIKALELEHEKYQETCVFTKKDVIQITWKYYIPTAIMTGISIGCMIGSNTVNLKRNAALASLYSLSETALKEYRTKVVETIGQNKERKIKDEIVKDRMARNTVNESDVIFTGNGDTLCYDSFSGRYFKSDIEKIKQSLNKLSRDMLSDNFIALNEVYYALGLKSIGLGNLVGWHVDDGLIEPDFDSTIADNGQPCIVLNYTCEPRYNYGD